MNTELIYYQTIGPDGEVLYFPPCAYCGRRAATTAWYGDQDSAFGGGQLGIHLCNSCPSPCNHYADPHASFTHEIAVVPSTTKPVNHKY